ncbi:TraB/GumN family protein [Flavobacterium sp. TMP13]|uniref:TraB/GumN family protein n=1 Tax=Flavobacterium sp. TMP13 TaxID=3425950 RepID=UPI003D76D4E0
MKNAIKLVISVLVLFLNFQTQAQNKEIPLEKSLLWEVSGNGLKKSSFIYGTIHMICAADFFITDQTKKALESSGQLVLEINLTDPKEIDAMQKAVMGKEGLSRQLTSEELSRLSAVLNKTTGMTIAQVDNYSLVTVMSLIVAKAFGCADLKFYEMDFIEKAKEHKISVNGLETMDSQLETLKNAYTNSEMIRMLEESNNVDMKKFVTLYKEEDIAALFESTTDPKLMNTKTQEFMLDKRNKNWVAKLPTLMQQQRVFVAVGAAHLAGKSGLINLLKEAGYVVKPVLK